MLHPVHNISCADYDEIINLIVVVGWIVNVDLQRAA